MKKLVFVHLLNDYSGSPKVLTQVINAVNGSSYSVDLYVGNSSEGFLSNTTADKFTYYYNRSSNKFFTLLSFLCSQIHLASKIIKYRNDNAVIYVNTLLPFGAGIIGKLLGKRVIYHIHETSLRPKLLKVFLRWIVSKTASNVIFVSNTLKDIEQFKNKKQKIVYNALPKSFFEQATLNKYNSIDKGGAFNVYMIASLRAYKGINEFVKIAQKCLKNKALKFILILNANQTEINEYFKNSVLASNTYILPTQQCLHQHYEKASLLLNLSRVDQCIETFGLTIIEAMSYGIPVIVPPVGGPSEIVDDNVEGYLISSYNTDQIVNKIDELYNDNSLCFRLSKNAKLKSKKFNEAIFNKQILEILND